MTTEVRVNTDGIDAVLTALGSINQVRIGLFGDSAGDLVEIGAKNEFGSIEGRIPPRSFLRMPLEAKSEELLEVFKSDVFIKHLVKGDTDKILALLGIKGEAIVQEAFETSGFGNWKPNSPATIAAKGSSKPLIDTGAMRRAVTSKVEKIG